MLSTNMLLNTPEQSFDFSKDTMSLRHKKYFRLTGKRNSEWNPLSRYLKLITGFQSLTKKKKTGILRDESINMETFLT